MGPSLQDILIGLLPMLLLIAAWYFFMRQMRGPQSFQSQCLSAMRQTEALERIAAALERRQ